MGLFSWCTSDTKKSIAVDMAGYEGCPQKVYLLNPFGNPYIETNYEGYGVFNGNDVYALVAKWNTPELCKDEEGNWLSDDEIRNIGIDLSCYGNDHVQLKYPIKIVEKLCEYDEAGISPSCPFQGFFYPEDPDCDDEEYDENDYSSNNVNALEKIQREVEGAFEDLDNAKINWKLIKEGILSYDDYLNKRSVSPNQEHFDQMVAKWTKTPQDVLAKILETSDIFVDQDMLDNKALSNKVLHLLMNKYMNKQHYQHMRNNIMKHPNYVADSIENQINKAKNNSIQTISNSNEFETTRENEIEH